MTDARALILDRIRSSLSEACLPDAPPPKYFRPPAASQPLAAQFADEWQRLGGIFLAARREKVPALVTHLLRERGAETVLYWQAEHLPVPEMLTYLRREGFSLPGMEVPPDEPRRSRRLAEMEKITVGVTGVEAVLADTGSLVLRSGAGRSRLASLTVWTHIALFTPAQLYASLAEWWAAQADPAVWVTAAGILTLISGPSRTADIEMTLTTGVHGPGEVIAMLVEE